MMDQVQLIILGAGVVLFLMFVLWVVQFFTKNAGIVDLGWTVSLVILAGIYAYYGPGYIVRKIIIFSLVALWGIRLTYLLIGRLLREQEDSRYKRIRKDWGGYINFKFLLLFEAQALLDVVLSLPFLIVCFNTAGRLSLLEFAGVAVWLTGIVGESIADEQLKKFRNNPDNKGKVCQNGLWNYSRHPNYFFEWLMWVAYFIFALASPWGWISVICPIMMLYTLLKVTGIPMIEEHALKTKGEAFRRYKENTSYFIPLPKIKREVIR